ncbi:site-specific integrase [Paenibacillus antibioticophila]|uniref:Site-specific integrase n=2 Tax=Paenibacillus antibioticophila TaxID=1274374 RepID=A0A920CH81_9BACL|nr:site-specific integrase [Paenibacillus antibioticophila]
MLNRGGDMKKVQPIRDDRIIEGMKHYFYTRNMRNYLFFCIGIYSGLRVSDLCRLTVAEVRGTHVNLIEQKNKHAKRFVVHHSIRSDLDDYIKDMKDSDYIFQSRQIKTVSRMRGQPIDRTTAYRFLVSAGRQFGLTEIGCHTLRKTWAYRLYMQDPRNLALLMEMFGHTDPAETLDYIGLTQDMMDKAIQALN